MHRGHHAACNQDRRTASDASYIGRDYGWTFAAAAIMLSDSDGTASRRRNTLLP